MTDQCNRAQEIELHEWERHQQRPSLPDPAQWQTLSARQCAGCACTIPEARRRAVPGVQLCVSCQEAIEHLQQRNGK